MKYCINYEKGDPIAQIKKGQLNNEILYLNDEDMKNNNENNRKNLSNILFYPFLFINIP